MMPDPDLIPCPFCKVVKDGVEVGHDMTEDHWWVWCDDCHIRVHGTTRAEAIANWNARSYPTAFDACEVVEAVLDDETVEHVGLALYAAISDLYTPTGESPRRL